MPYIIKKVKNGYKVCKNKPNDKSCLVGSSVSRDMAQRRIRAILYNTHHRPKKFT